MSWVSDEEMAHARGILECRKGIAYGRWHNGRVEALLDEVGRLHARLEQSHRTCMDDCSVCGGDLDVIGISRCSDGKGGMRHTNLEDCQ